MSKLIFRRGLLCNFCDLVVEQNVEEAYKALGQLISFFGSDVGAIRVTVNTNAAYDIVHTLCRFARDSHLIARQIPGTMIQLMSDVHPLLAINFDGAMSAINESNMNERFSIYLQALAQVNNEELKDEEKCDAFLADLRLNANRRLE